MKEKVLKVFFGIIVIFLLIVTIRIIYLREIKKQSVISLFGKSFFIVETGSMEPTIEIGELIVVSKKDNYNIGDIVTIIDEEDYIYTHRIIDVNESNIITRGDNNDIDDEETNIKNIVGKVGFHSKLLGSFVVYWLRPLILIDIFAIFIKMLIDLFYFEEEDNEKVTSD